MQRMEVPTAMDAANNLLTQHPEIKYWFVAGGNDSTVLGGIRAMEARGFAPDNCIGIGIGGTDCIGEFEKSQPTPLYGAMLLAPREHGYETAKMMFEWIKDGKKPPLDTRTAGRLITRDT